MNKDYSKREINFLNIQQVLKSTYKQILAFSGIVTLVAILYCFLATPIFTANIIINPPKITDSGSGITAMVGNLSALVNGGGGGVSGLMKNDSDMTIAMLNTREVQDSIINKFELIKHYKIEAKNHEIAILVARAKLYANTEVISDAKSGFLTIQYNDYSPVLAAQVANYYITALGQLISRVGLDQASAKLEFYEDQLKSAKDSLDIAENNLTKFVKENGITAGIQANIMSGISTQLQARLALDQSQLQAMQKYVTENNPDYQRLLAEISGLKSQIANLSGATVGDNITIPSNLAPELAQKFLVLGHEALFRGEIYGLLLKQEEFTKMDNYSDQFPTSIKVIEKAEVPPLKSKPQRVKITLLTLILSLLLGSVYQLIKHYKKIIVINV